MQTIKGRPELLWAILLSAAIGAGTMPAGGQTELGDRDEPEAEPAHEHDESEHRLSIFETVEVAERGDDLVGIASSAT